MEGGWEEAQRQGQDIAGRFHSLAEGFRGILQNNLRPSPLSSSCPSSSSSSQQSGHRFVTLSDSASNGECCEDMTSSAPSSWPWPWIGKPSLKSSFLFFNKIQVNKGKLETADLPENGSVKEDTKFMNHDYARLTAKNGSKKENNTSAKHDHAHFTAQNALNKENKVSANHEYTKSTNEKRSKQEKNTSKEHESTRYTTENASNVDRKKPMKLISAHPTDENGSKKDKKTYKKHDSTHSTVKNGSNVERNTSANHHDSTYSIAKSFTNEEEKLSTNYDFDGLHEIGKVLGQARAELGACINGLVNDFTKNLPLSFQGGFCSSRSSSHIQSDCEDDYSDWIDKDNDTTCLHKGSCGIRKKSVNSNRHRIGDEIYISQEQGAFHDGSNEELFGLFMNRQSQLYRQGNVNVTTTYDSRTREIESSVTARGDLWRAEATHGRSSTTNGSSPLFLLQIGPLLFVRDSTLLLPIHLSKQHLLWYGFDRKNGLHSVCPAMWSKRRRWLVMSMICLNPFNCSFMDIQFPNGQLTYVAGEGITSSAFFPVLGGLLQAQCAHPDVLKLSFSKKMRWGTRVTPSIQLPERALSVDLLQPLAWKRSGMIVRPTVELRVTPTIGGRNAGWKAEFMHSPKERLSWACGCALTIQPTAYASIALSNAKRNSDDLGRAGLVLRVETPVENPTQASFQIQLNSGVEF